MKYEIDYQLRSELGQEIDDYYLFPVVEGEWGVVVAEFLYRDDAEEYCRFKNSQQTEIYNEEYHNFKDRLRMDSYSVLGDK